jgi:sugar lactone lactonase YvrE
VLRQALALAFALAWAMPGPVQAQGTQAMCEDAPAAELFLEWDSSLENLAFDGHGHLYLSDSGRDQVFRVGPDGDSSMALDRGGNGLVWGPDDRLYVAAPGGGAYDILRSTDANASAFEAYVQGVPTYNGLAFDGAGNLYASDDNLQPPATPPDVIRIPRADPAKWEAWTDLTGADGIAYDPVRDVLYTDIVADQSSPILRISPVDKAVADVVAYLSFGLATLEPNVHEPQGDPTNSIPKGPDDLTVGPDGLLYVAGHVSGEVIRLDTATGDACILASGLEEPSSLRFARGFGEHGGKLFVSTWGGNGVTGLGQTTAGMPPAGKVWMFDLGFTGGPTAFPQAPSNSTSQTDDGNCAFCGDEVVSDEPKKDTPGLPAFAALLVLAIAAIATRRPGR